VNFLGHLCLADRLGLSLTGTLLGDFVKGPIEQLSDPELRCAVRFHRQVDGFTDTHPLFRKSKRRLDGRHRHFRGVLVDLFYDHFLALHWRRFHHAPLARFCSTVYGELDARHEELPATMQPLARAMVQLDLLGSYRHSGGIARALGGMARRFPRKNTLAEGAAELDRHREGLEQDFLSFFPLAQRLGSESAGDPR